MVQAARSRPDARTASRSLLLPVAGEVTGLAMFLYGFVVTLNAVPSWLSIEPRGTVLGPPTYIQWWNLQLANGLWLLGFGAVLLVGSLVCQRTVTSREARGAPSESRALVILVSLAIGLGVAASAASALPAPQRTLQFPVSDFTLRTLPGNLPYENYFVSVPFQAYAGETLLPWLNFTLTDNRTLALELWQFPASAWYTSPSALLDWRDPSSSAFSAVIPQDGQYVLWVRYDFCATPGTLPCNNYTGSVAGELVISDPVAYQPWMLGLGLSGCVAMAAAVAQSGMGRRRTTS